MPSLTRLARIDLRIVGLVAGLAFVLLAIWGKELIDASAAASPSSALSAAGRSTAATLDSTHGRGRVEERPGERCESVAPPPSSFSATVHVSADELQAIRLAEAELVAKKLEAAGDLLIPYIHHQIGRGGAEEPEESLARVLYDAGVIPILQAQGVRMDVFWYRVDANLFSELRSDLYTVAMRVREEASPEGRQHFVPSLFVDDMSRDPETPFDTQR